MAAFPGNVDMEQAREIVDQLVRPEVADGRVLLKRSRDRGQFQCHDCACWSYGGEFGADHFRCWACVQEQKRARKY